LILAAGLAYLLAPDSLARLHGRFFGPPLEIYGLDLDYGRGGAFLPPGGTLAANPDYPIRVLTLQTNRWRNYDLSLQSSELNLERLSEEAVSLVELLGEDYFKEPRTFRLEAKEGSAALAVFTIQAAFTAADWAVRGDASADPDRKIGYYRQALALEPNQKEVKSRLALALEAAGRTGELAEFWEAELSEAGSPDESIEILTRLLGLYRKLDDQPLEIGALERLLALRLGAGQAPESSEILLRLLAIYREDGARDKEIETLERLLALRRETREPVEPIVGALAVMLRKDRPLDSAKHYEELFLISDPANRRGFLSELISIYEELGSVEGQIGAWERFLEVAEGEEVPAVWDRLVALRGEAADDEGHRAAWAGLAASLPDGQEKADAYKRLGNLWLEADGRDKAEEAFREASKHDPDDVPLFLSLARLAAARGDRAAYRDNLEKALAAERSADLVHELAQAFEVDGNKNRAAALWLELAQLPGQGQGAEAVRKEAGARLINLLRPRRGFSDEFEKRLFELSDNPVEFYNLGVSRFKAKHWERSEKAFLKAMELDRENKLSSDIRGFLLALYKESGQADKMVAQAMRLYKDNPGKKEYRDLVLSKFETSRDWAGLAGAAGEWTVWGPNDPDNWRFLALGQRNAGQPKDAAKSLLRAAQVEGTKVASWMAAAEALEKSGERQAAADAYKKVVEIEPSNEKAESALLRLALDGVAKTRGSGS
jgi:tetratricopeptide (TPR) repeat protein